MAQFLTTAQVAEQAGKSVRTVSRWIGYDDGKLRPSMKIPGQTGAYLFDPKHVAEFLERRNERRAA